MTSIEARRAELIFFSLLTPCSDFFYAVVYIYFTHNLFDILADLPKYYS